MPLPRKVPKIPRFSQLVGDAEATPKTLPSPFPHENQRTINEERKFNPSVAAYTLSFVGVLVGGLYIGAQSKIGSERRQVYHYVA